LLLSCLQQSTLRDPIQLSFGRHYQVEPRLWIATRSRLSLLASPVRARCGITLVWEIARVTARHSIRLLLGSGFYFSEPGWAEPLTSLGVPVDKARLHIATGRCVMEVSSFDLPSRKGHSRASSQVPHDRNYGCGSREKLAPSTARVVASERGDGRHGRYVNCLRSGLSGRGRGDGAINSVAISRSARIPALARRRLLCHGYPQAFAPKLTR